MAITKPFTFVAGTKARANEVNQNFDVLYSEVNSIDSTLTSVNVDIQSLKDDKANINGNASQRFQVANPVNNYDAVNKSSVTELTSNTKNYIDGLVITKVGDKTIRVSSGSCYDSTYSKILKLSTTTDVENTGQGANAKYYVYIVGNEYSGVEKIIISSTTPEPALPSGYTLYRQIGYFSTNSSNKINTINSYSNSQTFSIDNILPDYEKEVSFDSNTYIVPGYGWCWCWGNGSDYQRYIYINGHPVDTWCGYSGGYSVIGGSTFIVKAGDQLTTSAGNARGRFYPMKGM